MIFVVVVYHVNNLFIQRYAHLKPEAYPNVPHKRPLEASTSEMVASSETASSAYEKRNHLRVFSLLPNSKGHVHGVGTQIQAT